MPAETMRYASYHDRWAGQYDAIYEGMGSAYVQLTVETLGIIDRLNLPNKSSVVDFGAGTGRLAIPLAQRGYQVTAVEPSGAMLQQLQQKARACGVSVAAVQSTIGDFEGTPELFHLALCVFTVLNYLTEEEQLTRAAQVMAGSLKVGGHLLVEIPQQRVLDNLARRTGQPQRYIFEEHDAIIPLRYWDRGLITTKLGQDGLQLIADYSDRFSFVALDYLLFRKVKLT